MISEVGRPDDGTDPSGFYGTESYVPLKPHEQWPIPPGQTRPRTKEELVDALNREISETLVSVDWNFSQNIRNNVNETLSGVRGDNSVKIIGPDLVELENTADRVVRALQKVRGLANVGAYPHPGPVEPEPARRPRQVRAVEPQRQRRAGGGRYGRRRQGLQPDDRGRAELRHHLALPPRAALEPGRDPRHPGGGRQEHGGQQPVERAGGYARERPPPAALRPPAPAPRCRR